MITSNTCGFVYCSCNVAPAQALVLRLKSLKAGVRNKFLRQLIRFFAYSRYSYNKIHKFLRNHLLGQHVKNYFLSSRSVFGNLRTETYLNSFGDERLEKFFSFFGVGEVEFSHFTEEFHAAVF